MSSHGKGTAWKSTLRRQQCPAARQLAHLAGGVDICFRKVDVRWATRCFSSSLIRLLQSRVREGSVDFRVSLHWRAVSSLAMEVAVHPLTKGLCRDCLVWDVDETWRIEQPVQGTPHGKYCFLPWRGASNACVQPPARNARLTTQMRQPPARKNSVDTTDGITTGDKRTCSPAAHGAWHIATPCQMLACGVHVLDGYETLHDVFEENAHTLSTRK